MNHLWKIIYCYPGNKLEAIVLPIYIIGTASRSHRIESFTIQIKVSQLQGYLIQVKKMKRKNERYVKSTHLRKDARNIQRLFYLSYGYVMLPWTICVLYQIFLLMSIHWDFQIKTTDRSCSESKVVLDSRKKIVYMTSVLAGNT